MGMNFIAVRDYCQRNYYAVRCAIKGVACKQDQNVRVMQSKGLEWDLMLPTK